MKEAIRERARELGFDLCRFTTAAPPDSGPSYQQWVAENRHGAMAYLERNVAKRLDPRQILPEAKTIICVAATYAQTGGQAGTPEDRQGAFGIVARYARYSDYHEVLGQRLVELARFVEWKGGGGTRALWYVDTAPLLERDLAQRAGIGFVGKHTNLISRRLGNWVLLAEILTTLEVAPDEREVNRCGSCERCLKACPTGAITAPFNLDARLCISYLTIELKGPIPPELRPAVGNRIFGCDDCLTACPWNRFAQEGRLMKAYMRPDLASPDLLQLLRIDEADFKRRFADTPIQRAKRRGLLRNVCVALGNVGTATVLPALVKATHDPDDLVREHAAWAITQIKMRPQEAEATAEQ